MGIIAGATIGASILVISFLVALACFLYRRRKGSEWGTRGGSADTSEGTVGATHGGDASHGVGAGG